MTGTADRVGRGALAGLPMVCCWANEDLLAC